MSALEKIWDDESVEEAREYFGKTCGEVEVKAAYFKVGSSDEVVGLQSRPGSRLQDTLHVTVFMEGRELLKMEELHRANISWRKSKPNRNVDLNLFPLPFHMTGKIIDDPEELLKEFHMESDFQRFFPVTDQAPK